MNKNAVWRKCEFFQPVYEVKKLLQVQAKSLQSIEAHKK